MSRTQTPPTALTPAVQLRSVAGARRAIPRRIHGVRLAIASTARSERRIAVRRAGVGIDTSSASADPARGPWRSTAELPGAGHTTQLDAAAVLEAGARADDQVTDGPGDEDFAGAGLAEDPRRDVDGEPPDVGVQQFALAGVDASADLDAQCLGVSAQGLGAADGLRRTVERGEVAVAGALDHRAAETLREFGGDLAKAVEHRPPPLSPAAAACCVEATMSVNNTVRRARWD